MNDPQKKMGKENAPTIECAKKKIRNTLRKGLWVRGKKNAIWVKEGKQQHKYKQASKKGGGKSATKSASKRLNSPFARIKKKSEGKTLRAPKNNQKRRKRRSVPT